MNKIKNARFVHGARFVHENIGVLEFIVIFNTYSIIHCSNSIDFLLHQAVHFLHLFDAGNVHCDGYVIIPNRQSAQNLIFCPQIFSGLLLSAVGLSNTCFTIILSRVLDTLWIMTSKLPGLVVA